MKLFGKVFVVLILLLSGLKIAFAQKSFGELWKEYSGDQKSTPPPSTQGDNISKLKSLRELLRERLIEKEDEDSKIEAHKYFEEDVSAHDGGWSMTVDCSPHTAYGHRIEFERGQITGRIQAGVDSLYMRGSVERDGKIEAFGAGNYAFVKLNGKITGVREARGTIKYRGEAGSSCDGTWVLKKKGVSKNRTVRLNPITEKDHLSKQKKEYETEVLKKRLSELEEIIQIEKTRLARLKTATRSEELQFKIISKRPDDIAVIIANSNYTKQGKGIPNVKPAYTDGENIKRYFTQSLGVREGNIIYLKDATGTQLMSVFGSKDDHRGKLFNWTKPNVSKVYVYYAGHGAPAGDKGTTYLVPSDADSETVQLTGYPLKQLYKNLGKVPATSITVILEACFSGQSQSGYLSSKISGIRVVPRMPSTPKKITVISAGAANQVATWEEDESQSLFTKYFLKGMSGEGDKKPYGNSDGKVSLRELKKYLDGNMTYYARRYYGRTQQAQIVVNGKELSPTN